ncbi:single-strand DNA binding protein (SSB) (plasmid) [Deinococcus geothermalis DSM 11300]|uniref:Single-strand DNA binding protein (SSB) n=1 Tax=Deinococcus geothermalis (strain DSM 11300 / CIP 105573 / AG-3a) TaxID=319795 RepID=A8ZRL9_DEIGD|nr:MULTISPECIES: ssDNA-binding protein [Deinococcus]ABW35128.1 single-strand DNA binding protein (SSB) [Deinococcus geothermalis DSM 11300]TDE84598.1 ssDNA-binding protein [Deinococcus sp. S9]
MPARFTLLGALHSAPRGRTFTLAGTEVINQRGTVREVRFYHVLTAAKLEALHGLTVGLPYFAEGEVRPLSESNGKVTLQVDELTALSPIPTERDRRAGYVLTRGINQVIAAGHLATDVSPQVLPGTDHILVVNVSLRVFPDAGLLETSSYGRAAQALTGGRKGDAAVLIGRLNNEKRTDSQGQQRVYTRLESYRPSVGEI